MHLIDSLIASFLILNEIMRPGVSGVVEEEGGGPPRKQKWQGHVKSDT